MDQKLSSKAYLSQYTGILVKRIYKKVSKARFSQPHIETNVGEHFGVYPNVIKLLVSRTLALLDED